MNGVGSAGAFIASREAPDRKRSDIAVAVGMAAADGGFERMLGTERKPRHERAGNGRGEPAGSGTARQSGETGPAMRPGAGLNAATETARTAAGLSQKPEAGANARRLLDTILQRPAVADADPRQASSPRTGVETDQKLQMAAAAGGADKQAAQTAALPGPYGSGMTKSAIAAQGLANRTNPLPVPGEGTTSASGIDTVTRAKPSTTPGAVTSDAPQVNTDLPQGRPSPADGNAQAVVGADESATLQIVQDIQNATVDTATQQLAEAFAQAGEAKSSAATLLSETVRSETASQLTRQVRAQVVTQLVGKLGGLGGKGSLRLMLTPPELGRVEIHFTREGARLQLTFHAETAAAARALQDGAGQLQELLLGSKSHWQKIDIAVEHKEDEAEERDASDKRGRSRGDDDASDGQARDEHGGAR